MRVKTLPFLVAIFIAALWACDSPAPRFETGVSPIHTDLTHIKDAEGRYVHFRGTNVSGASKAPYEVNPCDPSDHTYIGRPFPKDQARRFLGQLRDLGFNSIRLLFMWEAVFPDNPDTPDSDFLDYFEFIIKTANEYGIYVLLNKHENLWSRHLYAMYNEDEVTNSSGDPINGKKGDIQNMLLSIFPPTPPAPGDEACSDEKKPYKDAYLPYGYTDKVTGDGAPLWATKLCLPEKEFYESKYWGMSPLLGAMEKDPVKFFTQIKLALPILGIELENGDDIFAYMQEHLPDQPFTNKQSPDMLPWTMWGGNVVTSISVERCYAAFFAGEKVYPEIVVRKKAGGDGYESVYTDTLPKDGNDQPILDGTFPIDEFLQNNFAASWRAIAARAKKYPNVIGYDVMNEPTSVFILLTAVAAYFKLEDDSLIKDLITALLPMELPVDISVPGEPADDPCETTCEQSCDECNYDCTALCGGDGDCVSLCEEQKAACESACSGREELCKELCADPARNSAGIKVYYILKYLGLLPPDLQGLSDEEKEEIVTDWGFKGADMFAMLDLNIDFDKKYLMPLYEKVSREIIDEDSDAIIWFEPAFSPDMLLGSGGGIGGQWEQYMTVPDFLEGQVIYSPHWYPDIYPNLGFNMPSREFTSQEYRYRDYTPQLREKADWAAYALSNAPVVFGEFGTYWNYRYKQPSGEDPSTDPGWRQSRDNDYRISTEILDNFYEAFEGLFMSNMVWCYTADNDESYGDWWNKEDFSIIDEKQSPRGNRAYSRPYPRAMSGKPVSMHFYSDYHYFDPEKGAPNPEHEFELVFESKETDAPTIIFVPRLQYPEGFYVWLSDGWAAWDGENQRLYFHPEKDDPGWRHSVRIGPPIYGQDVKGWDYFIEGDQVVTGE